MIGPRINNCGTATKPHSKDQRPETRIKPKISFSSHSSCEQRSSISRRVLQTSHLPCLHECADLRRRRLFDRGKRRVPNHPEMSSPNPVLRDPPVAHLSTR